MNQIGRRAGRDALCSCRIFPCGRCEGKAGTLQERAQKLKARRESILIEMAGTRRDSAMPLDKINAGQIDAFGKVMRTKLLDRETDSLSNTWLPNPDISGHWYAILSVS